MMLKGFSPLTCKNKKGIENQYSQPLAYRVDHIFYGYMFQQNKKAKR
jgi:hypothetical protein